ncbi:MAG: acyltransferase [Tannerella sp.]|nr:acyltransferase [Tannerella sp.]MDO4702718.1 acyltransferase [Tannerella sp.]
MRININRNCYIDVLFRNYVGLHAENHVFSDREVPIRTQGVTHPGISIGRNCWIGVKVAILYGVSIGDGCVIAAGAVVTAQFPANCIIGVVPAKIIKYREPTCVSCTTP